MREIHADLTGAGRRFTLVATRFNDLVVDRLVSGAVDALRRHGVSDDDLTLVRVPGAFELPLACRAAAAADDCDAVVALGAVVRGSTPHFDHVCAQAARGILDASVAAGIPVALGLLTCDTMEQALDRAGGKAGNKGAEAAMAALEMVGITAALGSRS